MTDKKLTKKELMYTIKESLGIDSLETDTLEESYVVQAPVFSARTDFLSKKSITAHLELMDGYVEALNHVSAELDGVDPETANANDSHFRSLKIDETYNLNAAFLHGLFFGNIADPQSQITMDSLTYLRLERDFGTFDAWQKNFIACAMSARNGWAVMVYNTFLNRYMNVVVDLHSLNVPFAAYPIVVLDMWEHAYYRDYLNDKKTYVFAMMKEFNWDTIEERVQKAEKITKVTR